MLEAFGYLIKALRIINNFEVVKDISQGDTAPIPVLDQLFLI